MIRLLCLALAVLVAAGVATAHAQRKKTPPAGLLPAEQKRIENAVRSLLLSGRDAKFRFLPFVARKGNGPRPYCGLVNARNAIGRYAGEQPFLAYVTFSKDVLADAQVYGIATRDRINPVTVEVRRRCAAAGYKLPPVN